MGKSDSEFGQNQNNQTKRSEDSAVREVKEKSMEVKTWYVMRPASCSSTKDFWYSEDTDIANVHLFFDTTCIGYDNMKPTLISNLPSNLIFEKRFAMPQIQ